MRLLLLANRIRADFFNLPNYLMNKDLPIWQRYLKFSTFLSIAIAIAIILRVINLGSREFWYDEVLSVLIGNGQKANYQTPGDLPVILKDYTNVLSLSPKTGVVGSVINILKGLAGDVHPPLSYLSFYLGMLLFGNSESVLRSVSVLYSIAAIFCAYGLGKFLLGNRGGLLLAALLAVNPFYLSHSLNARMYSPLLLWTVLSSWAILELRGMDRVKSPKSLNQSDLELPSISRENGEASPHKGLAESRSLKSIRYQLLWSVILIGSVTAGLLTQYLFAYWVMTLGVFIIIFDRRFWWQHGLCLVAGVLLGMPWFLWGTRQQLRNRGGSISQISQDNITLVDHFQDIAQSLGSNLVLGEWVTSLPIAIPTIAGAIAIAFLVVCSITLWQKRDRSILGIAFVLGIVPLLLALATDIVGKKLTIGFGWGRSMIFILPGCLLLITIWIERGIGKWKQTVATILLLFYLTISIADFSSRHRLMFHQIADIIKQEPTTPTLVAMNSNAWGHVLRLAYYIPANLPVQLLTQDSEKLASTLEKTILSKPTEYQRILWLDSARPVWGPTSTPAQREEVHQILDRGFKLDKTQQLSGTMELDKFTAYLYQRE